MRLIRAFSIKSINGRSNSDQKDLKIRRVASSLFLFGLVALMPAGYLNAQSNGPAEWHRSILNEIISLRSDLLEFLMEGQRKEILNLNRQLDEVRRQQKQVQEAERQRGDQISQIEQQLLSPELEPEARPQIEATKGQLIIRRWREAADPASKTNTARTRHCSAARARDAA
jgi:hypothetical protein